MLSIITAIKNVNSSFIQSRLNFFKSAFESGVNFEWVIQASEADFQLGIVCKDASFVSFKSESDISIYDAWNKAIDRAKGKKICFLGIDDLPTLEWLLFIEKAQLSKYDAITCRVEMILQDSISLGIRNNLSVGVFDLGNVIFCHPGIVFSSDLFINKKFNQDYKIIGDSLFYKEFSKINVVNYYEQIGVQMQVGGISNSRLGARHRFLELIDAIFNGHIKNRRIKILIIHFPGFLISFLPQNIFSHFQRIRWKFFKY